MKVIVVATLIAAALSSAGAFQIPASHVGLFSKSSLAARSLVTTRLRGGASSATMATFYDLSEKDAAGAMVKFDKFKGKVVYGVNVASKCGYTASGYSLLSKLSKMPGVEVAIFPCNQVNSPIPYSCSVCTTLFDRGCV